MQKLLIIGYVWPEPNSSAAGRRMLDIIHIFLQQKYKIIFASPALPSEYMFDLESIGVESKEIAINDSGFDEFVNHFKPDVVLFDRFMIEEQFGWRVEKCCPQVLRLLDTEDLHFLRDARHKAIKQNKAVEKSDLHSEKAKREVASILRCDLTLMISEYEIELLEDAFNVHKSLLHYMPILIDSRKVKINTTNFSQRKNFVFVGNFRHEPNWDAVLYLKQAIWPLIRKKLPNANLNIYGAYPPEKAMRLNNKQQGFNVLGWANDVNEVMSQSRVCLAPLRFGAGIKGKLIDAMQAGLPSVTTTIGAEAMHGELPWCGCVTDNPEAFAKSAINLYEDENLWNSARENGFDLLIKRYSKEMYSKQFIERINELLIDLEQHRLNNFTGAMLRHHTMKSTQYMAQWIETKNKQNKQQ